MLPTPPPDLIDNASVVTGGFDWAINSLMPVLSPVLALVIGLGVAGAILGLLMRLVRGANREARLGAGDERRPGRSAIDDDLSDYGW